MEGGAKLLIGAMLTLVLATATLVVIPYLQLSELEPPVGLEPYSEAEWRGRQHYIAHGCVSCHSQQPRDPRQAPDASRGWGRAPTAADYYYDRPHLLGTMRTGPDLLNIGKRQPSRDWHLGHLYQPRAFVPGSIMPPYPFLFESRGEVRPGEVAVALPPGVAPEGMHVVATPEALDLVAYLLSLDRTYPVVAGGAETGD